MKTMTDDQIEYLNGADSHIEVLTTIHQQIYNHLNKPFPEHKKDGTAWVALLDDHINRLQSAKTDLYQYVINNGPGT